MKSTKHESATLLLTCPDRKGLVAGISQFLWKHGANILHADQHQDSDTGLFLMRIEWDLYDFTLSRESFPDSFQPISQAFNMTWRLAYSDTKPRMAVFVSGSDHCLADILHRYRIGELSCEIPLVISNHPGSKELTEFYRIPYIQLSIDPERKAEVENIQLDLLRTNKIDFIVLARYMQILSPNFVHAYENKIINIHHSFLPAFIGAKPYHQAYARGVKLIGATSHFVTETLDEGPIIHQDVAQISHRNQISDLIQKGRDIEKLVLCKSIKWYLENRIIICGKKTVVFD